MKVESLSDKSDSAIIFCSKLLKYFFNVVITTNLIKMVVLLNIILFALLYNISCSDIKKDWSLFMTVSNSFVDNKFDWPSNLVMEFD
jgi:ABC-type transport system involved in cytochrome bd biosynthesis fused ATPase/permease subunit